MTADLLLAARQHLPEQAEQALALLDHMRRQGEASPQQQLQARLIEAEAQWLENNWGKALIAAQRARQLARRLYDTHAERLSWHWQAQARLSAGSDLAALQDWLHVIGSNATTPDDTHVLAFLGTGNILEQHDQVVLATKAYRYAYSLATKHLAPSLQLKAGLYLLSNLTRNKNTAEAQALLLELSPALPANSDPAWHAEYLLYHGHTLQLLGDTVHAHLKVQSALTIAESHGLLWAQAHCNEMLAELHAQDGESDAALQSMRRALDAASRFDHGKLQARLLLKCAHWEEQTGAHQSAFLTLERHADLHFKNMEHQIRSRSALSKPRLSVIEQHFDLHWLEQENARLRAAPKTAPGSHSPTWEQGQFRSAILVEIQQLWHYNLVNGRASGDALLAKLAQYLRQQLPEHVIVNFSATVFAAFSEQPTLYDGQSIRTWWHNQLASNTLRLSVDHAVRNTPCSPRRLLEACLAKRDSDPTGDAC
ncbi:hypothetical protein ACTSKR_04295 [Chitinibacteraceae bacterium HSL-7]